MQHLEFDLPARVDALARELALARHEIQRLRRRRRAAPAIAVGLLLAVAWSWVGSGALRAQVTSAAGTGDLGGRVAALEQKLTALEQGHGRLRGLDIVNADGKPVVSLSSASGEGLIAVNRSAGDLGVALSGDGNVGVFSGGKAVAGLKAEADGRGTVTVGHEGVRLAVLTTTADHEGMLTLHDAKGVIGAAMTGDGNAGVFDNGKGVVSLRVENGIGKVVVGNSEGKRLVTLSPDPLNANVGSLRIMDSSGKGVFRVGDTVKLDDARITVGRGAKGNYAISVADDQGHALAQLGQAQNGTGVVTTYDTTGTIRAIVSGTGQIHVTGDDGNTLATMVAEGGQGAFSIRNKGGTTIVRVSESSVGGGLLQLADQGGSAMVEAVVLPGHGVVRAYPLGNPGVGLIGVPGTFISGFLK